MTTTTGPTERFYVQWHLEDARAALEQVPSPATRRAAEATGTAGGVTKTVTIFGTKRCGSVQRGATSRRWHDAPGGGRKGQRMQELTARCDVNQLG